MNKFATLGLLALLPLAACNTNATNPMASTVPMPMPTVTSTSSQDQNFAMQAASSDMFEIQSSQLAVQKARRPAVRAFAQRMIDAHTMTTQKLTTLASQKGVTLPNAMDPTQQRTLADLDGNTRTFDAAYVAAQVAAHRTAISTFQTETSSGTDPDMKSFAQTTLPDLQNHLALAQRLRGGR